MVKQDLIGIKKEVTDKQKSAVAFIENVLGIEFYGDIENKDRVSSFLSLYLRKAYRAHYRQNYW